MEMNNPSEFVAAAMNHEFLTGSVWEQIFVNHIFPLLATRDLCSASVANKKISLSIMATDLWINLAIQIHLHPYENVYRQFAVSIIDNESSENFTLRNQSAKDMCTIQLQQRHVLATADTYEEMDRPLNEEMTNIRMKHFLDILLSRLSPPLSFLLLFLTVFFLAQHIDGSDLPLWTCAAPPALHIVHVLILFALATVVPAKVSQK